MCVECDESTSALRGSKLTFQDMPNMHSDSVTACPCACHDQLYKTSSKDKTGNDFRLQTTIDFPIHLHVSFYKTGFFEALYKIPKSPTTTNNHFIGTLFDHFSLQKKYEHGFFTKVWRTGAISERDTFSSATCRTTGT